MRKTEMFGLTEILFNTAEGVAQTTAGVARLAASPITNLVAREEEDHSEEAIGLINEGVKKIGKGSDG